MYPVGFYDLRDAASPVPVVSTAFRPMDPDELELNPFRVFTSMLATTDARFFSPELRGRVERFLAGRQLFDPASDRRGAAHRVCRRSRSRSRRTVRRRGGGRVRAVAPADRPRLVRRVEPRVGGGRRHRRRDHHAHQPPDATRAGYRRVVPPDVDARRRDDRRDPGPTPNRQPRRVVAADVFSGARRAAALPR